tara:strand:- start:1076 stop:2326 length:1251 start_codon:yes stop_codon:yes gene_type:complete
MSLDQAPKMEEYFDLSMYGSTETGEDPDDENDCYYTRERYWYHPNYLEGRGKEIYPVNKFPEEPACREGDMITNDNGHIHQYFVYSPFGENMYQYNRNSDFNSRYRFNGKEIDPEPTERSSRKPLKTKRIEQTGNQYYGARYYDPKISVWLSVDAMSGTEHNRPLTPYHFCSNNPVNFIDSDGLDWYKAEDGSYAWKSGTSDNITLGDKQYNWVGGDDMKIDGDGANVIAISGLDDAEKTTFENNAVALQDAQDERSVIVVGAKSDNGNELLDGLKATTTAFGEVGDVAMRWHNDWRGGVGGLLIDQEGNKNLNGFSELKNAMADGSIKFSDFNKFYFLSCSGNAAAKRFTDATKITSIAAGVDRTNGFSATDYGEARYWTGANNQYYRNQKYWNASTGKTEKRTDGIGRRITVKF